MIRYTDNATAMIRAAQQTPEVASRTPWPWKAEQSEMLDGLGQEEPVSREEAERQAWRWGFAIMVGFAIFLLTQVRK